MDQSTEKTEEQIASEKEEFAILKDQAKMMGLTVSNNISLPTLRAKVQAKLNGQNEDGSKDVIEGESKQQRDARLRKQMHDTQMRLVRCRITNHNPAKSQLPGEFVMVGNKYLGVVKKFIPFDEAALDYHVPYIIFNELVNRQYNHVSTKKDKYNLPVPVQKLVPEYSVQVLKQLTQEELDKLAKMQAAKGSIDEVATTG